jgi:hypothetical protein
VPLTDDAFVSQIDPTGALLYSTYLGGAGMDRAYGLALDQNGAIYVTGETLSAPDWPLIGPFQAQSAGSGEAFLARLSPSCGNSPSADIVLTETDAVPVNPSPTPDVTYQVTATNSGSSPASFVTLTNRVINPFGGSSSLVSAVPSQGECSITPPFVARCSLGNLAQGAQATVSVTARTDVSGFFNFENRAAVVSQICDPTPTNNHLIKTTNVATSSGSFLLRVDVYCNSDTGFCVGSDKGRVTATNVIGIDCRDACFHAYPTGTTVYLSAVPDIEQAIFGHWEGDADCADGIVTTTAARHCVAIFLPPTQSDLVGSFGEAVPVGQTLTRTFFGGMPNPSSTQPVSMSVATSPPFHIEGPSLFQMNAAGTLPGIQIKFIPTQVGPVVGSLRFQWSGPGAAPGYALTQSFSANGTGNGVALAVIVGGSGTVTGPGIICRNDCAEAYTGTPGPVTLTATPNAGSAFHSWSGCSSKNGNQCTVTAPKTVTATFRALPVKKVPPPRTPPRR